MSSFIYQVIYITVLLAFHGNADLTNYIGTDEHNCISCFCYARTQCFNLTACANYSISYEYWERAGAPTMDPDSDVDLNAYKDCMRDDNCILNTIMKYAETFGGQDCVCDDEFNCLDMLSVHYFGANCKQVIPKRIQIRYNYCARVRELPLVEQNIECVDIDL